MGNCSIFTYLDIDHRERLFGSTIVSGNSVDCFRHIVQHQIKIDLIFLKEFIKNKPKKQNQELVFKYSNQSKFSIHSLIWIFKAKIHVFNFNYKKQIQNITIIAKTNLPHFLKLTISWQKQGHFNTCTISNYI